jgi:lysozyme family protein
MTARFQAFIPLLLDLETEHNRDGSVRTEHDPDDPGGATKYGIDQRSHPQVAVGGLTEEGARAIYFAEWVQAQVEALPARVGELIFDIRVNGGPGAVWLQRFLGVNPDGFLGPKTLGAARMLDAWGRAAAVKAICIQREARFHRLAETNPRLERFLKGWLARSARVRAFCLEDAV